MSAEPSIPAASDATKALTERTLTELLRHMGVQATLEVKDAADGSISVAITVEGDGAGLSPGKRSQLLESVQFLVNKLVNKTPQGRRWINLGVGAHPPPRQPQPAKPPPAAASPAGPSAAAPTKKPQAQRPPRQPSSGTEAAPTVVEDPALTAAVRDLAEKSAKFGRFMAVLGMSADDRARTAKALKDVPGVTLRSEGEGRNRRLSLHPDKPAPMPKSLLPDYDDDEEDDDGALD